jgi:hypothetical protein
MSSAVPQRTDIDLLRSKTLRGSNVMEFRAAEAFDDFLDHATDYLKRKMKNEAGTIAGAVFEDTTRRIYRDTIGDDEGKQLEYLINQLAKSALLPDCKVSRPKLRPM